MKEHPASTLFPLLRGAEFDALVKDIETHGQQEAIYRLRGAIIDGRNRLRACEKLGVKPWIEDLDPEEHPDPHALVMSLNFHRRHLRPHEKGAALAAYMQRIGAKKRPGPGRPKKSAESADSPSIASVAKQLGVAERTARDNLKAADAFETLPEDLKGAVGGGDKTLREAVKADRDRKEIEELKKVSPEVAKRRKQERARLDRIETVRGLANRVASTWLALDRTKTVARRVVRDDPKLAGRLQQEIEKLIKAAEGYLG